MKRKCLMLSCIILLLILTLTGCSGSANYDTTQKQTYKQNYNSGQKQTSDKKGTANTTDDHSWSSLTQHYEIVTYDKIKSGSYPGQYVIVSCVIDNVQYFEISDRVECDVWFKSNSSFICDNISFECNKLKGYEPRSLNLGDNIKICVFVERDNSFGSTIIGFSKDENTIILSDIHNSFKEICKPFDCEQVRSDPKTLRGTTYTLSGNLDYIVTEDSSHIEFILSTDNNESIYIYYIKKDKESTIPQGLLKIYGTFYMLKDAISYKSMPYISAEFIESSSQTAIPEETQEIPTTTPPVQETTQEVTTVLHAPEETTESPTTPIPPVHEVTYILNTNTMKIHVPSCSSVDKISPKNYATTTLSIPELEEEGYSRCGRCLK